MILQCSNCNARYLVPDTSIGAAGKTVRCAKCGHSWFENPPPALVIQEAAPEFTAMLGEINKQINEEMAKPEKPLRPTPIRAGSNLPAHPAARASITLKASCIVVTLLVAALSLFIMFPSLYNVIDVNGVVLTDVKSVKRPGEKYSSYEVSGNIINASDIGKTIPTLRVTLVNDAGDALQMWEFRERNKFLEPKQFIPFTTGSLEAHFSTGTHLVVELGTKLELALRRKPTGMIPKVIPAETPTQTPTDETQATPHE